MSFSISIAIFHLIKSILQSGAQLQLQSTTYVSLSTVEMNPLALPDSRTPLGGIRAKLLANDPKEWHLKYWLDILILGTLSGEPGLLMSILIQREQNLIPDQELRTQVREKWGEFVDLNVVNYRDHWIRMGLGAVAAEAYLDDLDKLLTYKETHRTEYRQMMEALVRKESLLDASHTYTRQREQKEKETGGDESE